MGVIPIEYALTPTPTPVAGSGGSDFSLLFAFLALVGISFVVASVAKIWRSMRSW